MTIDVWVAAAALVVASVLIGRAVALLCGGLRLAAPAFGLSVLIIAANIAIALPGQAVTAAIVLLILVLAAVAVVIRAGRPEKVPLVAMIVAGASALGAAIPFIANGRVGLLGVSLDNDTQAHLIWAQSLRSAATRRIYAVPTGYPLGPHSLADSVSSGLGVRLDFAFTGLMIALVIVTALVASDAFAGGWAVKRVVGGVLGALFYLVAAYYAEGAFKEQLMGLLLLAFVLYLEEVPRVWSEQARRRWRLLIPAPALIAAGIYDYSYLALAWFGLTLAIWIAVEFVRRPSRLRLVRGQLRQLAIPAAGAILVLLLLLVPNLGRITDFFNMIGTSPSGTGAIAANNLGNLIQPLSPYEALGVWTTTDFRIFPGNVFHAGELSAFALGVLALGIAWSVARREFVMPAAIAASAIIYWRATHGQSPYVYAKALVIAGPAVAVTGLRGLFGSLPAQTSAWLRLPRLAAAIAFIGVASYSSYQVLRNEPVWPAQSASELLTLAKVTRGQTVLFLGNSDYAEWLFHDSRMSALSPTTISLDQAVARPTKPANYGTAIDFDSVSPADLNSFHWVITTNTSYASQPPAAFELVRQLPMYDLYKRVGTALPRDELEPPGAPGAVLNCRTRSGRQLSHERGIAAVMTTPVLPALSVTPVPGGHSIEVGLGNLQGQFELSLQYESAAQLEISVGDRSWRMPAYLDRQGPWFRVGTFSSAGTPAVVTIKADRPSAISGPSLGALISGVVATRVPDTRQLVPLARACGQYVDWYRLG